MFSVAPGEVTADNANALAQKLSSELTADGKATAGQRVKVQTDRGPMTLLVVAVQGDYATVDPNHPLSGQTLHFAVEVIEVRDATAEELAHGHAHAPGDHHH